MTTLSKNISRTLLFVTCLLAGSSLSGQLKEAPYDHVVSDEELVMLLNTSADPALEEIQKSFLAGRKDQSLEQLAGYFREKLAVRYFFSWKDFDQKFKEYNRLYSGRKSTHQEDAREHMELYPAYVKWKMPFTNLKGENVAAYPYRHLTRQEKAIDIALLYCYTNDSVLLNYIPEQARSLNEAFNKGLVETIEDGNGAFEALHAGKRMYHWLFVNQVFLASDRYTWRQQIEMIRTFIHTAAQLEKNNRAYKVGNHQTLGVSALAQLAILFPEIKGSDRWLKTSFARLEEHLEREIYPDGFQFERTVHYHIADIENYFYPWQLARRNNLQLSPLWDQRMKGMFDALIKIATPDKSLPVLQDDTEEPWAEYNELEEVMAFGTALYNEPSFNYFSSGEISYSLFWYFTPEQIAALSSSKKEYPRFGSTELANTGYYVMREGWDDEDKYMIIAAGLTPEKPDHQHGDMLGIQAYAYGHYILPNYQVRYSLPDLEPFKNSWVKSVCTMDSVPQGISWNQNSSGFGKWNELPVPEVITWHKSRTLDYFAGRHDGYSEKGAVAYRQIFFMKNDFWIIRDRFVTDGIHSYQQIWQGHYSTELENRHIRSVFYDGAGLDIVQLANSADTITGSLMRGKGHTSFTRECGGGDIFTTLLYPFENFNDRIPETDYSKLKGWNIVTDHDPDHQLKGEVSSDASLIVFREGNYLFLDASKVKIKGNEILISNGMSDLWITAGTDKLDVLNAGIGPLNFAFKGVRTTLNAGEMTTLTIK
ncbi:MAG: heparinase II/III family protein [Bacteroidales bacterium]|nr:heparinase II/III family protein [Bacteroidales bacterium]